MAEGSPLPHGYSVPVHRSLTAPILLAGAPRLATIINGTLAGALGLGLQLWGVGLVFWIVAQGLCVFAARRDPQFTEVLIRHIRQKAYYAC
ncbi:VirB3 family type IV secretion system protein [Hyphomonas sp. ND6WE1B]|uniref:VirB3 family type IV secretion system protein n=1 Tax=Hyphomonas sp. ND6WE1B TaxID=1848191 RepID=UPI0008076B06|nr:VirB3 family type IV secretion system protein [Hyphomonas sp. ND6WE1B]